MPNKGENNRFPSPVIIAIGSTLLVLLALATQHYFPKLECPIKSQWNIDCPGCGGTRAMNSLIDGNLSGAFSLNPLITTGIILVASYFLFSMIFRVCTGKYYLISFSIHKGISLLLVIAVFTIARNI